MTSPSSSTTGGIGASSPDTSDGTVGLRPVPLPTASQTNLEPPDRDEVVFISRGLASASAGDNGPSELQLVVLEAITKSMTGFDVDFEGLDRVTAAEFAEGLRRRDETFRTRMVQLMELSHMLLDRPSVRIADRVIEFAEALSVGNDCIYKARAVAEGSRQLVAADFDRSSYISELDLSGFTPLASADDNVWAWTNSVRKPELAQRWRDLGRLEPGTLGRGVHDFYQARGFRFPGEEGSAPPLLAQHDWVHVIADYGSKVESELEVFAFIARASDNPEAFTLLAMVLNLFHSGNLDGAAGLFEADPGHLGDTGMPERLGDAMRRGALGRGSIDFLAVDYFSLAHLTVDEVRDRFGVTDKSAEAVRLGSAGPWEPGGISETQLRQGRQLANDEGRTYDSYGATVDRNG